MKVSGNFSILRPYDRQLTLGSGRTIGFADLGDPSGKPIIYNHGGLSCRLDITWAHDLLVQNNLRVIALDRPGIGLSDQHANRRLIDWPDDVCEVADQLGLDKFGMAGWSCGGPSALVCAWKIPDRLTGVAAIASTPPLEDSKKVSELFCWADRFLCRTAQSAPWIGQTAVSLATINTREGFKQELMKEVNSEPDRKVIEKMSLEDATDFFFESVRNGPQGVVDDYRVIVDPWEFELKDIRYPVHLFHGDEDGFLPRPHLVFLNESIPGSKLHTFQRRGHFLLHNEIVQILKMIT